MFMTDVSNASRTLLLNIHTLEWDTELLELFDIPRSMPFEVKQSSEVYGETSTTYSLQKSNSRRSRRSTERPLGNYALNLNGKKHLRNWLLYANEYGRQNVYSINNLLTTVAWKINGKTTYALEGSVFVEEQQCNGCVDGAND
jgi:glycerol kinase